MIKGFIIGLASLCIFNVSYAAVQIHINGVAYVHDALPRLDHVLMPVAAQEQWHWPSSQLFNLESAAIETQRDTLIQLLSDEGTVNAQISGDYQTLINEIKRWPLADRIQIDIDFDLARYSLAHNPRFVSGNYLLTLSERPNQLFIFGAVASPSTIDYAENTCVDKIISNIARLKIASLSYVYLISPAGDIQKAPIAHWNSSCVVPAPGSSLYIPIHEHQWSKTAYSLNQQVISLALNRIQVP